MSLDSVVDNFRNDPILDVISSIHVVLSDELHDLSRFVVHHVFITRTSETICMKQQCNKLSSSLVATPIILR